MKIPKSYYYKKVDGKPNPSQMSGKLKKIGALNVSPLDTPFCQRMRKLAKSNPEIICGDCYSCQMLVECRKNCRPTFKRNGEILSSGPLKTKFVVLEEHFRIDAHGDLHNYTHLKNVMKIIIDNPKTFFGLWTKRPNLVQRWLAENEKPENVNFIYSSPLKNRQEKLPKGFDKVFTVYTEKPFGKRINCGSKDCIDCKICYSKNSVRTVNEILK